MTKPNPTRTITVEIDPDKPLPDRYLGCNGEGEPQYGPVSLYDAIITAAADRLVSHGEKIVAEVVRDSIAEQVKEAVAQRLPVIIHEAFEKGVTEDDGWGGRGVTTTVHEKLVKEARSMLDLKQRSSSFDRSPAAKFIHEEIERIVRDDLKAELDAARAAVRQQVTVKAAELLAAETMRAAGIR